MMIKVMNLQEIIMIFLQYQHYLSVQDFYEKVKIYKNNTYKMKDIQLLRFMYTQGNNYKVFYLVGELL